MEYIHILLSKITLHNMALAWNYAVKDNLFNFVLFVAILAWIFKKADIKKVISTMQEKIANIINEAKKNRDIATSNLEDAKHSVENLPKELEIIKNEAEKSAEVIAKKILDEAEKQVETIQKNAQKVIEAEERLVIANLTKDASKASIENARKKVQWELLKDASLHEKYINQSIDELDRLNF